MKSQTLENCSQIAIALITGAAALEAKIQDLERKKNISAHDPEGAWQWLIDRNREDLNSVENARVAMRNIQNSLQSTIAKELEGVSDIVQLVAAEDIARCKTNKSPPGTPSSLMDAFDAWLFTEAARHPHT
jgi:hypothetical protein